MKIPVRLFSVFLFLYLLSVATPGRAEENAGLNLFPVYNVTLGNTAVDELLVADETETEKDFEANGSLRLGSIKFGYEERILTTLEIMKNEPMPPNWKNAGFEWNLSYQAWISLLEKLGFSINRIQAPTLQMKEGHPVLESKFEAFYPTKYPTVFSFSFMENQGTGVASENVLYQISANYIQDFKGFKVEAQFENQESALFDESKRKALALSGIAAATESLNHEKLEFAVLNQASTDYWKKVLTQEWGINRRDQLLEKLSFLESSGDSQVYQNLALILKENRNLTINQMGVKFNYDRYLVNRLYFVQEKQELIGDRALRAWDYSRIAFLCRIGYQVGFLSPKEAWDHLQQMLTKVEGLYRSWEDYAANYIMGVIFRALESGREIEAGNQALRAYAELINNKGNAWQLPWNGKELANQASGNILSDVLYFPPVQYQAWANYLNGWQSYQKGEYNEALSFFENGLALDQDFTDLWLSTAMVYNAQTNYQKAIGAFNEYLKRDPDEYLPRIFLAEAYEKNNQLEEALDTYNKAIDIDDAKPEGFIGLGRVAINSGNYDLAISYLRIAESLYLTEDQGIFYTLYLLGYSHYKAENYDKAQSYFLRAYGNYQDNMYLNYYLGVCYLYNQNIRLASAHLEHAAELGLAIPPEIKDLVNQLSKP